MIEAVRVVKTSELKCSRDVYLLEDKTKQVLDPEDITLREREEKGV